MSTVGTEFSTLVSIDVDIDAVDPDFKNYTYSLDISGLPAGLRLEGDIKNSDTVKSHFIHVFKIIGTPTATANAMVNIVLMVMRMFCLRSIPISIQVM